MVKKSNSQPSTARNSYKFQTFHPTTRVPKLTKEKEQKLLTKIDKDLAKFSKTYKLPNDNSTPLLTQNDQSKTRHTLHDSGFKNTSPRIEAMKLNS
mmetsp:Transcript_37893/g.33912  ORF Transcript_37893/g.33912 Transcript_37893/m.33912 type:complete len:96 (+) Transcript_37893:385-672(+)